MKKTILIVTSLVFCFLVTKVNAISLAQFYPWWNQLRWEYRTQEDDKVFTQVVTCVVPKDSKKAGYDFYLDTKSVRHTKYYYQVEGNWIYLVKIDVKSNLFPIPLTFHVKPRMPAFPLNIDDVNTLTWKWEGKYSSVLLKKSIKADFKLQRNVSMDTFQGAKTGLKLYATYTEEDTQDKLEAWHVKDLGLVYFSGPGHVKRLFKINNAK